MFGAISLLPAHLGHWFEAAMFAPAAVLVIAVSVRSILEGRAEKRSMKENR